MVVTSFIDYSYNNRVYENSVSIRILLHFLRIGCGKEEKFDDPVYPFFSYFGKLEKKISE
jgi:hypothetical protein